MKNQQAEKRECTCLCRGCDEDCTKCIWHCQPSERKDQYNHIVFGMNWGTFDQEAFDKKLKEHVKKSKPSSSTSEELKQRLLYIDLPKEYHEGLIDFFQQVRDKAYQEGARVQAEMDAGLIEDARAKKGGVNMKYPNKVYGQIEGKGKKAWFNLDEKINNMDDGEVAVYELKEKVTKSTKIDIKSS